jgi:hypothetical protein
VPLALFVVVVSLGVVAVVTLVVEVVVVVVVEELEVGFS